MLIEHHKEPERALTTLLADWRWDEICGGAAEYFPTFDPSACAAAIRRVVEDAELRRRMSEEALRRAAAFTWERHVDALMEALDPHG